MRKLLIAGAFALLPMMGVATAGSAAAAAPGSLPALDRLVSEHSTVDQARYHRRYRCYRVCTVRNYRGRCVRSVQRCTRPVYRSYRRW